MNLIQRWSCGVGAAVVLLGLAHADERILDFHSDIAIAADASMQVSETIRVRA